MGSISGLSPVNLQYFWLHIFSLYLKRDKTLLSSPLKKGIFLDSKKLHNSSSDFSQRLQLLLCQNVFVISAL